jgi:glycosyltransferase involved in cell wall biosynthesis
MDQINAALEFNAYYSRKMASNPTPLEGAVPPRCIFFNETGGESPEYSIVMPIYNQEAIIQTNLSAIVKHTRGIYEMILILDSCSDNTERGVMQWVNAQTPLPVNCCRIVVIQSLSPLFECAADNVGFAVARAPYLLEIQADMEMTEPGYNVLLKRPFEVRDDVLGVSGRCCHGFYEGGYIGRGGMDIEAPYDPSLSNRIFYVYETCNRGPLMLHHAKLRDLGYLDEQNFYLDNSDHDLFARGWALRKWICGYVPIHFQSPLANGSTRKPRDPANEKALQARKARSNGGFYDFYRRFNIPRQPIGIPLYPTIRT